MFERLLVEKAQVIRGAANALFPPRRHLEPLGPTFVKQQRNLALLALTPIKQPFEHSSVVLTTLLSPLRVGLLKESTILSWLAAVPCRLLPPPTTATLPCSGLLTSRVLSVYELRRRDRQIPFCSTGTYEEKNRARAIAPCLPPATLI